MEENKLKLWKFLKPGFLQLIIKGAIRKDQLNEEAKSENERTKKLENVKQRRFNLWKKKKCYSFQ